MAYEDVPERLITGEAVPASEIIGYAAPNPDEATRCTLEVLCMMLCMVKVIVDDVLCYQITAFGQTMRTDFIVRLDEECPDCPECP